MDTYFSSSEFREENVFFSNLEELKKHPFSLRELQKIARIITGNNKLVIQAGKVAMRRGNTVHLPATFFENQGADGLEVLGFFLHEVQGHVLYTNSKDKRKIKKKAQKENVSESACAVLWNSIEDCRINTILVHDDQAAIPIKYIYEKHWSNATIENDTGGSSTNDIHQSLANARWKQFTKQIIFYWTQTTLGKGNLYIPGLSDEVKEAFDTCLPSILEAIYTWNIEENNCADEKIFRKEQQKKSFECITSDPLWSTFKTLLLQDQKEIAEKMETQPKLPEDSSIPPEENDTYYPQEMESQEAPGKAPYIFQFDPADGGYFYDGVCSEFRPETKLWYKNAECKTYETPVDFEKKGTVRGKVRNGRVVLPLKRKKREINVESIESSANIKVEQDQNGVMYLVSDRVASFVLDYGTSEHQREEGPTDKDCTPLFSGTFKPETEELLSSLEGNTDTRDVVSKILTYVDTTKTYDTGYQAKLRNTAKTGDDYFRNIDLAPAIECYSAAGYVAALCRRVGIPARLCRGHRVDSATDGNTSEINANTGHAWTEVWVDGKWIRADGTPSNQDQSSEQQEKQEAQRMLQDDADKIEREQDSSMKNEASDQSMEENKDSEYQDEQENEVSEKIKEMAEVKNAEIENVLEENNEKISEYAEFLTHVKNYVTPYVDSIIEILQDVKETEAIEQLRKQLCKRLRKSREPLAEGDTISLSSESIIHIVNGNPNIWKTENKLALKDTPEPNSLDIAMGVAIDCSGSMGDLEITENLDMNCNPITHTFYLLIAKLMLCEHFSIPMDITLFSSEVYNISSEKLFDERGKLDTNKVVENLVAYMVGGNGSVMGGGNCANGVGMLQTLKTLEQYKNKERLLAIVYSDGDGDANQFLHSEGREILQNSQNMFVLGAGIGQGATKEANRDPIPGGRKLSVIESQFYSEDGDDGFERTMGKNYKDFTKMMKLFGQELFQFLVNENHVFVTRRVKEDWEE